MGIATKAFGSWRSLRASCAVVLALLLCLGAVTRAEADARTGYLVKLLETSQTYRVRAQAALALGRSVPDDSVVAALVRAMRDENASVRAAAASSLGRVGNSSAVAALEGGKRDPDSTVRSASSTALSQLLRDGRLAAAPTRGPSETPQPDVPARFYVGVGRPGTAVNLDERTLEHAREFIVQRVAEIDGVVLAPSSESPATARSVLKKQNLTGYYLDSSVVRIEASPGSTRAVVSVIVGTYPGRDMRVILQGAATVQGGGPQESARIQAIEGALTGALRRLPQALTASEGGG